MISSIIEFCKKCVLAVVVIAIVIILTPTIVLCYKIHQNNVLESRLSYEKMKTIELEHTIERKDAEFKYQKELMEKNFEIEKQKYNLSERKDVLEAKMRSENTINLLTEKVANLERNITDTQARLVCARKEIDRAKNEIAMKNLTITGYESTMHEKEMASVRKNKNKNRNGRMIAYYVGEDGNGYPTYSFP